MLTKGLIMSQSCARRNVHLSPLHLGMLIGAGLILVTVLSFAVYTGSNIPVVEMSVSTKQLYMVKPDGTRVPVESKDIKGPYDLYKIP